MSEEKKVMVIPKERRIQHTASATVLPQSNTRNAADMINWYLWESFGGTVLCVVSNIKDPYIMLYVNDILYDVAQPQQAVNGKLVYEAIFTGLSNGDTYYCTINNDIKTTVYTYGGEKGSPPILSESASTISATMATPYNKTYSMALGIVTFNSDNGSLNNYSREARTRLFEACLQATEQHSVLGKVGNEASFAKDRYLYNPDTEIVTELQPTEFTNEAFISKFYYKNLKVGIINGIDEKGEKVAYYDDFSKYVDAWINDINQLLGKTQFTRDDTITTKDTRCIIITLGDHETLWGYNPDQPDFSGQMYYGTWEISQFYVDDYSIAQCQVKLCNELRGAMNTRDAFKDIVYEELTECLGCGNDTYRVYDSLFSQIWYIGKSNELLSNGNPTYDGEVVKMLYNELEIGELAREVALKLTPSSACVLQLPIAKGDYTVKPYAMNRKVTWHQDTNRPNDSTIYWWWDDKNNGYSDIGEESILGKWYWTTDIRPTAIVPMDDSGFHPVTAKEWNDFTHWINKARLYKGCSNYDFGNNVVKGQEFTPDIYNRAVEAIQDIQKKSDGTLTWGGFLSPISTDTELTASLFILLASELNAVLGYE